MTEAIRRLCALSVFCGLILCLTPRGGIRRLTSLCCALLMLLSLLRSLDGADDIALTGELARYRAMGEMLAADASEKSEKMNRRMMEEECRICIEEHAQELGLQIKVTELRLRWDDGGFWVPESVTILGRGEESREKALQEWLEAELGIKKADQEWLDDGG